MHRSIASSTTTWSSSGTMFINVNSMPHLIMYMHLEHVFHVSSYHVKVWSYSNVGGSNIAQKYQAIAVTRLNFVSLPPRFEDRHGVVEPFSEFLTHPSVYDWIDGAVTVRHEQGRILEVFEVIRNLQGGSN